MRQTFEARRYPSAIFFPPPGGVGDGDVVAGPFCVHCGNPFALHGGRGGLRCPDRHLHPLFPPPRLPWAA